jgi:hypothetical protein
VQIVQLIDGVCPGCVAVGAEPREAVFEQNKHHLDEGLRLGICLRHRSLLVESNHKPKSGRTLAFGHGTVGMKVNECVSRRQRESFLHVKCWPRDGPVRLRERKIARCASTADPFEHLLSRCLNHGGNTTNPFDREELVLASQLFKEVCSPAGFPGKPE